MFRLTQEHSIYSLPTDPYWFYGKPINETSLRKWRLLAPYIYEELHRLPEGWVDFACACHKDIYDNYDHYTELIINDIQRYGDNADITFVDYWMLVLKSLKKNFSDLPFQLRLLIVNHL